MPVSPATLRALAPELDRRAHLAWVQKVYQPVPTVLILHLYGPEGERRLAVDVAPTRLAVAFLDAHHRVDNPPAPPSFCMLVRKHVEGKRLVRAEPIEGERILRLDFSRAAPSSPTRRPNGDGAEPGTASLVLELTGRSANVVLLVDGRVAGTMRKPGAGRQLAQDEPYRLPPPAPAPGEGGAPDQRPVTRTGAGPTTLDEAGEAWFQAFERERLSDRKRAVARILSALDRRLERRLDNQRSDLERAEAADTFRQAGEWLLAYAPCVPRGATRVVLPPEGQRDPAVPPVTVELDPSRTATQNAELYFRRYQKAKRAVAYQQQATERTRQELDAVRLVEVLLAEADDAGAVISLHQEALELARTASSAAQARAAAARPPETPPRKSGRGSRPGGRAPARGAGVPVAAFRSDDGLSILVGKSARANDELTLHRASPDDWWLHARQMPGAHVVVRGAAALPERTLLQAAALAARFSAQGQSGVAVPVDVTRRRHVRKPPGAPYGFVLYDHERTVWVRPDPDALPRPVSGGSAARR